MNRIIIRTFLLALLSISSTSIFCQKITKEQVGSFTLVKEMIKVSESYDSTTKTIISPISVSKAFVVEDHNPYSFEKYKKDNYDKNFKRSRELLFFDEVNFDKLSNDFPITQNWGKEIFDALDFSINYNIGRDYTCIFYGITQFMIKGGEELVPIKTLYTVVIIDRLGNRTSYKNILINGGYDRFSALDNGNYVIITGEGMDKNKERINYCYLYSLKEKKIIYNFFPNGAESLSYSSGSHIGKGFVSTSKYNDEQKDEVNYFYIDLKSEIIYRKENVKDKIDLYINDFYWDNKLKMLIFFDKKDKQRKPKVKADFVKYFVWK